MVVKLKVFNGFIIRLLTSIRGQKEKTILDVKEMGKALYE